MTKYKITTRTIPTATLDPQSQRLIEQAGRGALRVIFESEDGKPVAIVMPVGAGQAWEAGRDSFFETIHEMQDAANLSPEEADRIALEEVEAARAESS